MHLGTFCSHRTISTNNMYTSGEPSKELKNAIITPEQEIKNQNYTGISMLNTCYKIYANIK